MRHYLIHFHLQDHQWFRIPTLVRDNSEWHFRRAAGKSTDRNIPPAEVAISENLSKQDDNFMAAAGKRGCDNGRISRVETNRSLLLYYVWMKTFQTYRI
jgi:hypothetical protein